MNNNFNLYGVLDTSTGKLISDITNPRRKYWDKKGNADKAVISYCSSYKYYSESLPNKYKHKPEDLKVVEIECIVKE